MVFCCGFLNEKAGEARPEAPWPFLKQGFWKTRVQGPLAHSARGDCDRTGLKRVIDTAGKLAKETTGASVAGHVEGERQVLTVVAILVTVVACAMPLQSLKS